MDPRAAKRKAFGQHFLRDAGVISQIVTDTLSDLGSTCLEIGPGQGALTEPLLAAFQEKAKADAAFRFILVEKDRMLAVENEQRISRLGISHWAKVHCADFLELSESEWLRPSLSVVSNLPYSSGTAILTRLCGAHANRKGSSGLKRMTLMFQAEVAERVRAEGGPGSGRDMGSLSVWVQNDWDVSRVCRVRPGAFQPPPKVESEVLRLVPRERSRIAIRDPDRWERLLKACFAHRRKMLRSGLNQTEFFQAFGRSGVEGTRRAQELTWEEWARIAEAAEV